MVDGEVLEFGVSGLLHQANMLMYDRTNESLWQQSIGEAVVGEFTGTVLDILPMQLISFGELKEKYPEAKVLSEDTGSERDYTRNPYSGYEFLDSVPFGVESPDDRYFPKKAMYVFRVDDISVAFPYEDLPDSGASTTIAGREVTAERDGEEVFVTVDGERVPGYVEMWFSFSIQHGEEGEVWEVDAE